MKKVLITGGAGFIGFHLARTISADSSIQIVLCDNLFRGRIDNDFRALIDRANVKYLNLDLTEKANLERLGEGFDIIYHMAAINGTRNFYEMPDKVLRVNILSLINVLDWMITSDCKRLVWASSSEAYSGTARIMAMPVPTAEEVPLAIDDVFNPRFSYAGSKIIGELLCLNYAKMQNLNITIIRPHNVYGPRMGYDHVIPQFINRIAGRADPFKIYGAYQTRAFCFITDFVRALIMAGNNLNIGGKIFNVGNDREEIDIVHLAEKLFELTGFHPALEILPPPEGSVERRCPDITRARKQLGYEPAVDLNQGLAETYHWYKDSKGDY